MIAKTSAEADIEATDIIEVVLVGNPIMHHLIFGLGPTGLGAATFALVTNSAASSESFS